MNDGEPEEVRVPTWRDVFTAMHTAGYKLKCEEREPRYRKWIVPVGTMGEVASISRSEIRSGRVSWSVDLYGYLRYSVRLHNPPPADVLDAAKLVKLLDTPEAILRADPERRRQSRESQPGLNHNPEEQP